MRQLEKFRRGAAVPLALMAVLALPGCDRFASPETKVERATASLQKGEAQAALDELRPVVEKDPANRAARILMARALFQLGENAAAAEVLGLAFRSGAPDASSAALAADIQLALGKFAGLEKQLASGELPLPDVQRAIYRGRALTGLNRQAEAKSAFEQALAAAPDSAEARTGLANLSFMQGDFANALKLADEALGAAPGNIEALRLRGLVYLRRGQFREAEAQLRQANEALQPSSPVILRAQILAALTEACLGQGKLDEASKVQSAFAALLPDSAAAQLLGIRITLARGGYAAATADLQRLVLQAPDYIPARMLLGAAHLSQGHLEQADAELSAVVQRAPDNVEARKLLARARMQLDRPDAALSVLTPALEGDSDDADIYSLIGAIQLRKGSGDSALDALEKSSSAHPDDERRKLDLAAGYISQRRFESAAQLLRSLPPSEESMRREALLLVAVGGSGGPRAARAELEKMLAERPSSVDLMYLASAYFRSQREFDRARVYINKALESRPDDARGLLALASLEIARNDLPAAEAALRRALAKDPSDTQVRIALAELAVRTGKAADGIAILEEGRKQASGSAVLGLALARVSFAANDPARARKVLDEVLTSPSRGPELSNQVGGVLLDAGRFDEAVGRFRDAVDADPRNPLYLLNLARAQLALDQSAAASESIQRALDLRPNWLPAVSTQVLIDLRARRTDKALATVQGLRKSAPEDARLAMLEGDVRMAGKQYKAAVAAYADADKLKPSATSAIRLHQARRAASMPRAEDSLIAWLGRHPEDVRVRTVLAQFYLQGSRLADAAGELESISREQPNDAAVLNNLGWIYQELGDKRALATARRAHELAPTNPAIADTYGWILFTGGDPAAALPLLEAAARVAARDPEIQYHYASALAAAGRKDEARETLRKVMGAAAEFRGRRDAEKLLARLDG